MERAQTGLPAFLTVDNLSLIDSPQHDKNESTTIPSSRIIKFSFRFLFNSSLKEDHNDHIFSVTFDPFVHPNQNQIFATVAKNGLRIYECKKDKTTPIHVSIETQIENKQVSRYSKIPIKPRIFTQLPGEFTREILSLPLPDSTDALEF